MRIQALRMNRNGFMEPFSTGGRHPVAGQPLVLLIHGYNNDEPEAADSFFQMRCNLDNVLGFSGLPKITRQRIQSNIWEFYWPGYQPLGLTNPRVKRRGQIEQMASALSYSLEVRKARSWVADGLFEYLIRNPPSELFFVAHSLGCRVALETAKRLLESLRNRTTITGFLLMAGAVPIDILAEFGSLGATARIPKKRYCLYSWLDKVLMMAFPPGQLMAGEVPLYGAPIAAGFAGLPASLWNLRSHTRLNHGDYWTRGIFANKSPASEILAGVLGFAVGRHLPHLNIPELPSAQRLSILPVRHIASGKLPGSHWLNELYAPKSL